MENQLNLRYRKRTTANTAVGKLPDDSSAVGTASLNLKRITAIMRAMTALMMTTMIQMMKTIKK